MTITITENTKVEDFEKQVAEATADFRAKVESFGYEVVRPFYSARSYCKGNVEIAFYGKPHSFLPDVRFDQWEFDDTEKQKWTLNMGAFGSLSGDELTKWFEAQKAGYELVKYLESLDIFEVLPKVIDARI